MTKDEFLQHHPNQNQPVTVGVMLEAFEAVLVPAIDKAIVSKILESYDQLLLPAIDQMFNDNNARSNKQMKENNAEQENHMKDYIDRKFYNQLGEFSKRLDAKIEKEKQFKEKVIDLFKRYKMGTSEEIAFMEGLAQ